MHVARAPVGPALRVDDFSYDLPEELIAQTPSLERDAARLLVLERSTGLVHHSRIRDLADWLDPGDLVVANNSRVIPARLVARKANTDGQVELLLLQRQADATWRALARPARRLRSGTRLILVPAAVDRGLDAELHVVSVDGGGLVTVAFGDEAVIPLDDYGTTPLPPHIREPLAEPDRYQTVFATVAGSVAAPTAGLHFTPHLLESIRARGIGWAEITRHIGLDTFRPVTAERVEEHQIHREWCSISDETAGAVAATKRSGCRVVALGTTAARALETLGNSWDQDAPKGQTTMTDLFIVPGYRWRLVDAMLTNFHTPRSTLIMMVSAFAGLDSIRRAYSEAISLRYRFFSFGDAMLIR